MVAVPVPLFQGSSPCKILPYLALGTPINTGFRVKVIGTATLEGADTHSAPRSLA